ncbi:hypothetical protein QAD02_012056 [Eretmocerus hayati]|uniref:Uncharacterized protein n=1 Tax=Eretmocerus hayati TaxID=131215 RepID=A0ACC2NYA3_9HYME|nr:hypothetical protein QAD02_012056 [Eretmocerus hayati]
MNFSLIIFLLIFVSLGLIFASNIKRVSTVTKLPDDVDQHFKSSLGLEGFNQWFVHCEPLSDNITTRDCNFNLGKTSLEAKHTTWIKYRFQMKTRTKTSKILPDYLKVFHFGDEIFLVIWIEYDSTRVRVRHVDDKDKLVGLYVKFVTLDIKKSITDAGSTMGSPVGLNPIDGSVANLQEFIESIKILVLRKKFAIVYPYTKNFDLAQEIFRLDGHKSSGSTANKNFKNKDRAVVLTSYPKHSQELRSQEHILHQHADLCKEMQCNPTDFVDRKQRCSCTTTHGNVTSCVPSEGIPRHWDCVQKKQVDDSVIEKSKKKFSLEFWNMPKSVMVYNLPNGDVLTMSIVEDMYPKNHLKYSGVLNPSRTEELSKNDFEVITTFHLRRFGIDGHKYISSKFIELDFECTTFLGHFFEYQKIICFSLVWMNHENLGYEMKCFDDKILSVRAKNLRS